jgi:hypothetical protein
MSGVCWSDRRDVSAGVDYQLPRSASGAALIRWVVDASESGVTRFWRRARVAPSA